MRVIGLMSGTSLDGIDVALLDLGPVGAPPSEASPGSPGGAGREEEPYPSWELMGFESVAYQSEDRERIHQGLASGGPRDLALLHTWLGERFAEAVLAFLHDRGIAEDTIGAIGSHGQTIWHEPPTGDQRGTSLQLGCPATLAERTGIGVVSDFRSRDLAAGGHGAPLVPWADRVLFSSETEARAIQNLGGMGNVTWLPKRGVGEPVVAFDTGPGVALLDGAAELATGGRLTYDLDGTLARRGRVNQMLLDRLLGHPFFRLPPPRSTGRETFGRPFLGGLIEALGGEGWELVPGSESASWCDLLATLVALTARSIGDAYREWLPAGDDSPVYLTGGGARNPTLAEAITREVEPRPIRPAETLGLDPDAREATAFALLAWAHVHGVPANVPDATGSSGPRILGSWTPGRGDYP